MNKEVNIFCILWFHCRFVRGWNEEHEMELRDLVERFRSSSGTPYLPASSGISVLNLKILCLRS